MCTEPFTAEAFSNSNLLEFFTANAQIFLNADAGKKMTNTSSMIAHHCMVHVRELERAEQFYTKVLGLSVAERHFYEGGVMTYLTLPGTNFELELICPQPWPFADRPEPGRTHVAFTVGDIAAEHKRLRELGIQVGAIEDHHANGSFQTGYFFFDDPDGNQLEFLVPVGRYRPR